jgi:hypothetical protein
MFRIEHLDHAFIFRWPRNMRPWLRRVTALSRKWGLKNTGPCAFWTRWLGTRRREELRLGFRGRRRVTDAKLRLSCLVIFWSSFSAAVNSRWDHYPTEYWVPIRCWEVRKIWVHEICLQNFVNYFDGARDFSDWLLDAISEVLHSDQAGPMPSMPV